MKGSCLVQFASAHVMDIVLIPSLKTIQDLQLGREGSRFFSAGFRVKDRNGRKRMATQAPPGQLNGQS